MKPTLLHTTLTGVDEKTSFVDLKNISYKYPNVEWGILYVENQGNFGKNRYPSNQWFVENKHLIQDVQQTTGAKFALHVCGESVKKMLSGEDEFLMSLLPIFNRVQINFIYKPSKLELLESLMMKFPEVFFITQHNNANKLVWKEIQSPNHQILFDKSGGRGIVSDVWESPLSDKVYGYAGGLGPENVTEELDKITKVVNAPFWIDMESKIRTEDYLDLKKCEDVLSKVDFYLKSNNTKYLKNK